MNGYPVRKVVIAGGGTAGWSAATALSTQLKGLIEVTLVESEDIATIGVGESTVPTAHTFHSLIGIDEREFIRESRGAFKLGISFENWARDGDRYFHSFGILGKSTWMADFHHYWLDASARGLAGELGEYCLEYQAGLAHRFKAGAQGVNYAYHLDAALYARFLRRLCEEAGFRRIEGKIERVEQNGESGFVEALVLESGERVEGDLFLDCTGFRSLLLGQTLGVEFEDWSHWLPTDSALPTQTASVRPAAPYTSAIAHSAGWQWRIPLQQRVGCGFVYASDFLSDDEAHAQMKAGIEGDVLLELNKIRFKAGGRRKAWEKNVVSLGLAGGFIEPLESTSIHLMHAAVTRLLQSFPFNGINPALIERFNRRATSELHNIRDFIILHYHQSERDDSEFWRYCRNMSIPDSLAERLALFEEDAQAWQGQDELFRIDSWVQVMLGQRLQPRGWHRIARQIPDDQLRSALGNLRSGVAQGLAALPQHQDFLDSYSAAAA